MSTLARLVSSRVRAEVLRLLFGVVEKELHVRELARQAGFHEASMRQELKKLRSLDLVVERRDGNRAYYRANVAHPLYPELHRVVLKTAGLVEVLRDALGAAGIEVAFVFGSIAQGHARATSDIDLLVIGDLGLRPLTARLAGVAATLGRELNPHCMTSREVRQRRRAGDPFLTRVLASERLFVIGSDDDLAAVAS